MEKLEKYEGLIVEALKQYKDACMEAANEGDPVGISGAKEATDAISVVRKYFGGVKVVRKIKVK